MEHEDHDAGADSGGSVIGGFGMDQVVNWRVTLVVRCAWTDGWGEVRNSLQRGFVTA